MRRVSSAAISDDLAQHAQRPRRDVLEVADGRGDHEQRAGHRTRAFIVPLTDRNRRQAEQAFQTMIASEPLPHFVDDLLGYLHETHPTYATLDGVHTHDDLLEDLSRQAIEGRGPRACRATCGGSTRSGPRR